MCKVLKISRTVYYYESRKKKTDGNLEDTVTRVFMKAEKYMELVKSNEN